jgi:hypothetical protein
MCAGLGACHMVQTIVQLYSGCNVKQPQPFQWYASSSDCGVGSTTAISVRLCNHGRPGSAAPACAGGMVQDMQACVGTLRLDYPFFEPCARVGPRAAAGVAGEAASAWWCGECCGSAEVSIMCIAQWGVPLGRLQRAQ